MKRINYFVARMAVVAFAVTMIACGGSDKEKNADDKNAGTANKSEKVVAGSSSDAAVGQSGDGQINMRYIDEEKLLEEYSLAKDFQESITRLQSKLISAQESRAKQIQSEGGKIETKMKNNSYTSESEYNADIARLNKMQQDAQTYLANLQRTTEVEVTQLQNQLQDSVRNFVKEYSLKNGYDAVVLKSASLYFNPAFDVTEEVLKGLNARYNKVEK